MTAAGVFTWTPTDDAPSNTTSDVYSFTVQLTDNVAPTQLVAVIGTKAGGGRGLAMFRWGFVPSWANEPGPRPVNAKAETIAEKPSFRDSFRQRRCLIPADGFYEWRSTPQGKRPLHYQLKGGVPLAFAGIWDCWKGPGETQFTCAIVTTAANPLVQPVHNRMPVILPPDLKKSGR